MTDKKCNECFYGTSSFNLDPCKSCNKFDKFVHIHSFKDDNADSYVYMTKSVEPEGKKYDSGKPDWSLLPFKAVSETVDVLTFGAKKYGPENWRLVPNAKKRYLAAAFRHVVAYAMGEKKDPESGLSHLSHALCCLLFILELEKDDGPSNA
jgi:hypothetical protein